MRVCELVRACQGAWVRRGKVRLRACVREGVRACGCCFSWFAGGRICAGARVRVGAFARECVRAGVRSLECTRERAELVRARVGVRRGPTLR